MQNRTNKKHDQDQISPTLYKREDYNNNIMNTITSEYTNKNNIVTNMVPLETNEEEDRMIKEQMLLLLPDSSIHSATSATYNDDGRRGGRGDNNPYSSNHHHEQQSSSSVIVPSSSPPPMFYMSPNSVVQPSFHKSDDECIDDGRNNLTNKRSVRATLPTKTIDSGAVFLLPEVPSIFDDSLSSFQYDHPENEDEESSVVLPPIVKKEVRFTSRDISCCSENTKQRSCSHNSEEGNSLEEEDDGAWWYLESDNDDDDGQDDDDDATDEVDPSSVRSSKGQEGREEEEAGGTMSPPTVDKKKDETSHYWYSKHEIMEFHREAKVQVSEFRKQNKDWIQRFCDDLCVSSTTSTTTTRRSGSSMVGTTKGSKIPSLQHLIKMYQPPEGFNNEVRGLHIDTCFVEHRRLHCQRVLLIQEKLRQQRQQQRRREQQQDDDDEHDDDNDDEQNEKIQYLLRSTSIQTSKPSRTIARWYAHYDYIDMIASIKHELSFP